MKFELFDGLLAVTLNFVVRFWEYLFQVFRTNLIWNTTSCH